MSGPSAPSTRSVIALLALATTVALLSVPAAAGAATKRYEGELTTLPGSSFGFKVVERRGRPAQVKSLRFEGLAAFCENGQSVPVASGDNNKTLATLNSRGNFTRTQYIDRVDFQGVSALSGRIQGRKGRGLLSFSLRTDGTKCSTGVDRWEVDRVGG